MGKEDSVSNENRDEVADAHLSKDSVFGLLSNRRRRLVLRYLRASSGPVAMRDLAAQVAAWENDIDPQAVTYKQRKRVYTSLYQSHLPKMRDSNVVEYDRNRGHVALTELGSDLDRYLTEERGRDWLSWPVSLAVACALFAMGIGLGLEPLAAVPGTLAAVLVSVVFLVVAAIQTTRG
jgi:DNA-binding transcriptional ArsR family regulator